MARTEYRVLIPTKLVDHTKNVSQNIEVLVKLHFADWAMKSLVDQIQVIKPSGQGKKGPRETPPDNQGKIGNPPKKQAAPPAANLGV